MTTIEPWSVLKPCPKKYCTQPVAFNHNELIVAIDINPNEEDADDLLVVNGIYTYNVHQNEWKLLMEYPENELVQHPSICYESNTDTLYVNSGDKSLFVNINTKQFIIHKHEYKFGWYPKSIMIDGKYNVICGGWNNCHLQWNSTSFAFDVLHEFKDLKVGNAGPGVVHLKSKNVIILFGGFDHPRNIDEIWEYTLDDKQWKQMNVKLPDPSNVFGYTSSTDDKYIFILGGKSSVNKDDIYVIDTDEWKIMKSNIKCPMKARYHACIIPVSSTNNPLVLGYIRECCLFYKLMISTDIIKLISTWYYKDYLHLLKYDDHWKISIDHIIHQMTQC